MSFKAAQNPGNVNVRVGAIMALKEAAQDRGDWGTAAIHLEQEATYVLAAAGKPGEAEAWDQMPKFRTGDSRTMEEAVMDSLRSERWLLTIAKRGGIFARKPDLEITDADEDDEEEVIA